MLVARGSLLLVVDSQSDKNQVDCTLEEDKRHEYKSQ